MGVLLRCWPNQIAQPQQSNSTRRHWHGVGRSGRNKLPVRAAAAPAYFGMAHYSADAQRIRLARRDASTLPPKRGTSQNGNYPLGQTTRPRMAARGRPSWG